MSKQFEGFCEEQNVQHVRNATKTPRANGQIERYFGTVGAAMRTMTDDDRKWDEKLPMIQWGLNTTVNSTTNVTPQQLLFTYKPNDASGNLLAMTIYPDLVEGTRSAEEIDHLTNEVIERVKKSQAREKERFDSAHCKPTTYKENDLVLLRFESPATGESRKLQPRYRGPYLVKKELGNDRYLIVDVPGSPQTQKPFRSVYASDRMKPWCRLSDENETDEDDGVDENNDELIEDDQLLQNGRSCHGDESLDVAGYDDGAWVADVD
jgi:hypothetical protein